MQLINFKKPLTITLCTALVLGAATGIGVKKFDLNTSKKQTTEDVKFEHGNGSIQPMSFKGKKAKSENKEIFSCYVNQDNTPGFIPANEGEEVTADTFFVSNKYIFLDDTLGTRILMYNKTGKFLKALDLEWNQNVTRMCYIEKKDILNLVYMDLNKDDATYYHLLKIKVSTNKVLEDKELSNSKEILKDYYFIEDGTLQTFYFEKEAENEDIKEELEKTEENLDEVFPIDCDYEECYTDANNNTVTICSNFNEKLETVDECIVVSQNTAAKNYAVPEEHNYTLTANTIQSYNGKIYQMLVKDNKISIFELAQKKVQKNKITGYTRPVKNDITKQQGVSLLSVSNTDKKAILTAAKTNPLSYSDIKNNFTAQKNYKWKYKKKNRDKSTIEKNKRQYVARPGWLDRLDLPYNNPDTVYSTSNIPYCWGGYCKTTGFGKNLDAGYYAGNINTSSSSYIDKTAGNDCSGFVSIVYELGAKYGTYNLTTCGAFKKRTNNSNVKKGDVLIWPGHHVVIVTKVYDKDKEKDKKLYVDTVEQCQTFGRITEKIKRAYEAEFTKNGYDAYKYVNLTN